MRRFAKSFALGIAALASVCIVGAATAMPLSPSPVAPLPDQGIVLTGHGHGHGGGHFHGNRGRHLGWTIGRHRGWSHSHHR